MANGRSSLTWEEVEEAVANRQPERLMLLSAEILARLERNGDLFELCLRPSVDSGTPGWCPGPVGFHCGRAAALLKSPSWTASNHRSGDP
jgi:hypothetical protein